MIGRLCCASLRQPKPGPHLSSRTHTSFCRLACLCCMTRHLSLACFRGAPVSRRICPVDTDDCVERLKQAASSSLLSSRPTISLQHSRTSSASRGLISSHYCICQDPRKAVTFSIIVPGSIALPFSP